MSALVAALAAAIKPDVILETGAYHGHTTALLGAAAAEYGGRVVAIELDPEAANVARDRCDGLPVEIVVGDSLEVDWPEPIGLAFLDSGFSPVRRAELRRVKPLLAGHGVVVVHDTAPHLMGRAVHTEMDQLGLAVVALKSPRGVTIAQR